MKDSREFLIDLVRVRSTSGMEKEAVDYLVKTLPAMGWEEVFSDGEGNLVASKGSGSKELVLLCHVDTVPGGPAFRVEENILWGRGSVDAKGPLCALAVAGGASTVPDGWKITLIAAVREETDSGGARFRIRLHSPAACIVGEPSGTDGVTLGYRGSLRIMIKGEDGGAHRSGDSGPLTGCLMASAEIIKAVGMMDIPEKPVIERTSAAVAFMEGKEEGRRVGTVDLDIRIPIGEEPERWVKIAEKSAAKWGVRACASFSVKAHKVSNGDPVVRAFRVGIRKGGLKPRLLAKGGTADFNLAAAWKCPMAAYGPGDSHLDHTDTEKIDLDEYDLAISVLEEVIPGIMDSL